MFVYCNSEGMQPIVTEDRTRLRSAPDERRDSAPAGVVVVAPPVSGRLASGGGVCHVLREDPDLAEAIAAERRPRAIAECVAPVVWLPVGPWDGELSGALVGRALRRARTLAANMLTELGKQGLVRSVDDVWLLGDPSRELAVLDGTRPPGAAGLAG